MQNLGKLKFNAATSRGTTTKDLHPISTQSCIPDRQDVANVATELKKVVEQVLLHEKLGEPFLKIRGHHEWCDHWGGLTTFLEYNHEWLQYHPVKKIRSTEMQRPFLS